MRWLFKLLERSNRLIIYAYSTESYDLDGKIVYDLENRQARIMVPSAEDRDSKEGQEMALESFQTVISEDFPGERYICIG